MHWAKIAILIVIFIMSIIAFALYGIDKKRAKQGKWRIKESTLLLSAFLFGGIGAFIGMRVFRHKTKHIQFEILVPLFMVLNIAAAVAVFVLVH